MAASAILCGEFDSRIESIVEDLGFLSQDRRRHQRRRVARAESCAQRRGSGPGFDASFEVKV
jgi:hypothetical protein